MSTSRCGKICITPPKSICKKEGGAIILAVLLLQPPAPCPGDAVCHCERETTLFGIQKRYKSVVKLYLQHCSRTLQPKYCVCSAICAGLCPEPGRVSYNASVLKDFL